MDVITSQKIRTGAIIVAIILLVVAGVLMWRKKSTQKTIETPVTEAPTTSSTQAKPTQPIPSGAIPSDSLEAVLKRTTMDFVARFGTYSTDAENSNLKQLTARMGPTLRTWAENRMVQPPATGAFSGVTTRAISAKIITKTESAVTIEVGTQRTWRDEKGVTKTTYEIATANEIKIGTDWLVDSVSWKEYKP